VFDLFHIGHLNLLRNARGMCDELIVGVTADELVMYKGRRAVIPYEERAEIVRSVRYVDAVVQQADMNKFGMWQRLRFGRVFVGDDWQGTPTWEAYEKQFATVGVSVVYFPYTSTTSSTRILERLSAV
jgi:glycerol-3-phosphate cytidylyltransferase